MAYAIQRKVEDAIAAALVAVAPEIIADNPVYKGFSFSELTINRIEVKASRAMPQVVGDTVTGNYTVELTVGVVTQHHDGVRQTHAERAQAVSEVFLRSDIVALLNAAQVEDFVCYQFTPGEASDRADGKEGYSEVNATVFCAGMPPEGT